MGVTWRSRFLKLERFLCFVVSCSYRGLPPINWGCCHLWFQTVFHICQSIDRIVFDTLIPCAGSTLIVSGGFQVDDVLLDSAGGVVVGEFLSGICVWSLGLGGVILGRSDSGIGFHHVGDCSRVDSGLPASHTLKWLSFLCPIKFNNSLFYQWFQTIDCDSDAYCGTSQFHTIKSAESSSNPF